MSEEPITIQEILEIHADIIRDFGGASGIRDAAILAIRDSKLAQQMRMSSP